MRLLVPLICAVALTPAIAAAQAPAASPVTSDARCLMAMAALSSSSDQNAAGVGHEGVVYFAGRIKAREPSYDLGVRLKTVAAGLNGQSLQAEVQRCAPLVVEALRQLQAAQESLAPPASKSAPAPAAPAAPPKP